MGYHVLFFLCSKYSFTCWEYIYFSLLEIYLIFLVGNIFLFPCWKYIYFSLLGIYFFFLIGNMFLFPCQDIFRFPCWEFISFFLHKKYIFSFGGNIDFFPSWTCILFAWKKKKRRHLQNIRIGYFLLSQNMLSLEELYPEASTWNNVFSTRKKSFKNTFASTSVLIF